MFLCYFLRNKDSKSRTKINSSPGLIRAYVHTYGRRRLPNFLGLMDLPIPIAMDAPPAVVEKRNMKYYLAKIDVCTFDAIQNSLNSS